MIAWNTGFRGCAVTPALVGWTDAAEPIAVSGCWPHMPFNRCLSSAWGHSEQDRELLMAMPWSGGRRVTRPADSVRPVAYQIWQHPISARRVKVDKR